MRWAHQFRLALFALGCIGAGAQNANAMPRQIPPVSSDALEAQCSDRGGEFTKHADGSYVCHFRNGTSIYCDPDGTCVEVPPPSRKIQVQPNILRNGGVKSH